MEKEELLKAVRIARIIVYQIKSVSFFQKGFHYIISLDEYAIK